MIALKRSISIVLPAYNEEDVIIESVSRLIRVMNSFSDNYEIIIVNDGSTDNTEEKIKSLKNRYRQIRLIGYSKNRGKGYAIKTGFMHMKGNIAVMMDADLDIDPAQIRMYIKTFLHKRRYDSSIAGAIGSKLHKRSNVKFPLRRRVMSMGYYTLLKLLFKLDTKDVNTGLKVFDGLLIKEISPKLVTRGYAYDIELLSLLYKKGFRVLSLPVNCEYTRDMRADRIKPRHIIKTFKETMNVYLRNLKTES